MVAGDILPGLVCACAVAVADFCPSAAGSAYTENVAQVVECEINGGWCRRIIYAYWSDLKLAAQCYNYRRIDDDGRRTRRWWWWWKRRTRSAGKF